MLTDAERNVLNIGLQKYRPGQSEPILIGGEKLLKPALRLMSEYRLRVDEIKGAEVVTSYTRWLASVEARGIGKSGGLRCFQSELRTYLARIKEASPGVRFPETSQYSAPEPVCFAALCFGQKICRGGKKAHLFGAAPKGPRT